MSCAYFAALVQTAQQGEPIEGSLFERAYTKGLVAEADWRRLKAAPGQMLDAIDGIAKKVVDGRTIALGCSCPLDGGACHRNILRRAILQAAERKQREIDSRLYDRLRGRRHRSLMPIAQCSSTSVVLVTPSLAQISAYFWRWRCVQPVQPMRKTCGAASRVGIAPAPLFTPPRSARSPTL